MIKEIDNKFNWLEENLSTERLERYRIHTGGDMQSISELYRLNALLSERLYVPLHMLEVVLRNKIDQILSDIYGDHWFNDSKLIRNPVHVTKIKEAKEKLEKKRYPYEKGHLVAELTLGFWVSFFNRQYENLWQQTLHAIVLNDRKSGIDRSYFTTRLNNIRLLRNRAFHHEPIYHLNLKLVYQDILDLVFILSEPAYEWIKENSTFEDILNEYYNCTEKQAS